MQQEVQPPHPNFIPLFHKACKDCGHLFADERKLYENCHFSKGNTACPARTLYIGVGVNIEKASDGVAGAIINQDAIQLAKLADKLQGYQPEQTKKVLALVREKILNSYGVSFDKDGDLVYNDGEGEEAESEDDGEDTDEDGSEVNDALEGIDDDAGDGLAEAALIAMIDERVTLLLVQHQLIASPEALSPAPLPLGSENAIAGSASVAGTGDAAATVVSSDATQVPATKTGEAAEDDWAEG